MKNKKGFTLIEVIVSLVLLGILVVIAGMGLVQIVNGYVLAKQNSETIQKVQIAMARIGKELGAIDITSSTPIISAAPASVTYTRPGSVTNTLALSGSTVQINGITLINNVTDLKLKYFDSAGVETTNPANIRRIDIFNLTITGVVTPFTNSFAIVESYL